MALDDPNIDALDQVWTVWCDGRWHLRTARRKTTSVDGISTFQCEFFWTGFLALLPPNTVWYNDWRADDAADHNLLQLRVATELGFAILDTLVSSSAEEVAAFAPLHGKLPSRASAARADTGVRLPSTPRMRSRRYGKTAAMLAGTQTLVTINDDNFSLQGKGFHELLRRMGDEGYEAISFTEMRMEMPASRDTSQVVMRPIRRGVPCPRD
ncbi:hypothetical protein QRQ56_26660 [Bradyrhizobium sp. U531]|uniref:hypothetical protein n=1 Tax=Bradyrhizobium sp. U531 TaxID=3053458 RepID=UPI003F4412EF